MQGAETAPQLIDIIVTLRHFDPNAGLRHAVIDQLGRLQQKDIDQFGIHLIGTRIRCGARNFGWNRNGILQTLVLFFGGKLVRIGDASEQGELGGLRGVRIAQIRQDAVDEITAGAQHRNHLGAGHGMIFREQLGPFFQRVGHLGDFIDIGHARTAMQGMQCANQVFIHRARRIVRGALFDKRAYRAQMGTRLVHEDFRQHRVDVTPSGRRILNLQDDIFGGFDDGLRQHRCGQSVPQFTLGDPQREVNQRLDRDLTLASDA